MLAREREQPIRTVNVSTENKIDQRIIVKYDLEDLEAVLIKELAYKGAFAFSLSSPDHHILNDYIITRILDLCQEKTGRSYYKKEICISDNYLTLLEDIETELKEANVCNNILELAQDNNKLNIFIIVWNHILPPPILERKTLRFFEEIEEKCLNYLNKSQQCLFFILADTNCTYNTNGFLAIKTPNEFNLNGRKGLLEWFRNELSNRDFVESEISYCIDKLKGQKGDLIGTYCVLQQIINELNGRILNNG